jgi:hypothetical protein
MIRVSHGAKRHFSVSNPAAKTFDQNSALGG